MIPAITSIPASISRAGRDGREIGAAYQSMCVKSWQEAGFQVHSVNSRDEIDSLPRLANVTFWEVDGDARAVTGRPQLWFKDLMEVSRRISSGPFLLINSDILLRPVFDMASSVLSLEQGTALVAKRLEIDDVVEDSMSVIQPHLWGYDVFALHSRDIDRVEDAGLIFGAPWWDYMLPYSLIIGGVALKSFPEFTAYHLAHNANWRKSDWIEMGTRVLDFATENFEMAPAPHASVVRAILSERPRLRDQLMWRKSGRHDERKRLRMLAREIVRLVDNSAQMDAILRVDAA